ncbi:hypothetical protein DL766_009194 [Monosporascus sp. MC13-8B]|uniref:Uncharacterized protein n=1 Tax=Monosporascus cannonballus TaxID=155416 RepID=A0ABY0H9A8_9PEZI|nr:hypothetical protein DL762_005388 [Monosporascus cannonballus]RYP00639.1 hypothetical protein DL763_000693 [Monosporascus cannonballus]RYP16187.1 hypothetical protein DL766_009194 [Monosporascus sp. MC13-8B]
MSMTNEEWRARCAEVKEKIDKFGHEIEEGGVGIENHKENLEDYQRILDDMEAHLESAKVIHEEHRDDLNQMLGNLNKLGRIIKGKEEEERRKSV